MSIWGSAEIAASHDQTVSQANAYGTFAATQAGATLDYSASEASAANTRDVAQNQASQAHDQTTAHIEETRQASLWNGFLSYVPVPAAADAQRTSSIKQAGAALKLALQNVEAAFISAITQAQIDSQPAKLDVQRFYTLAQTYLVQNADLQEKIDTLKEDRDADLSEFADVTPIAPPLAAQQQIADANSRMPVDFWSAIETSLNVLTAGMSNDVLLSPEFTNALNRIDGILAGTANALIAGLSTRRARCCGEKRRRAIIPAHVPLSEILVTLSH